MSWQEVEKLIEQWSESYLIRTLAPLVTDERLIRMKQVACNRLSSLSVAVEGVWDIHNALAMVRSAEAFGVSRVSLVDCDYKKGLGKQTMRGTDEWMRVDDFDTLELFLKEVKAERWKLAAACPRGEMTLEALPNDEKICLFFGNEHRGLSAEAKSACEYHYRIPMHGMVESLNLSVAGAISLYTLSSQMRCSPKGFTGVNVDNHIAHFLVHSIGFDRVKTILGRQSKT